MKQYIQDVLLTKEALAEYIYKQRAEQAARYGLTVEQFMIAVEKGQTLTPISGSLSS